MNQKGIENLCNAIILQAVKDYRKACDDYARESIEHFFTSDWFKWLTDINGEWLLRELKKEVNQ